MAEAVDVTEIFQEALWNNNEEIIGCIEKKS